jgi:Ca-activated chloride channel homolog
VLLWLGRRQWAQALAASIVILSFGPFTPMTGPAAAADLSQRPDAEAEPSEWLEGTVTLLADALFTPDQQGYWLQYFGYLELAADRYETPAYRGYALYRSGQFRQAARVLQQVDGMQARFAEGNAWARASDYRQALLAYDKALAIAPEQMEIQHNRDRVLALVEAAFEQGESQMADLGDVNTVEAVDGEQGTEATDDEMALLQTLESSRLLSDPAALARWRAQVEASPARFLASRFKAEWLREQGTQDARSDP